MGRIRQSDLFYIGQTPNFASEKTILRMSWQSFFPVLQWWPRYRGRDFRKDILAGLTVGVMLVPQGMAYALLAGMPPIYGLYASIFPLLLYAIMGTSIQLSLGPAALVSILVLAGVGKIVPAGSEDFIRLAIGLALLSGLLQLLMGLLRMGFLINFVSDPVLSGFTSGAAIVIALSQVKNLFGVTVARSNQAHVIITDLFRHLSEIHWLSLAVGGAGILILLLLRRINKSIPGALIIVVISMIVVAYTQFDQQGLEIMGAIPRGLPHFEVPLLSYEEWIALVPAALTIGMISFIESLAIGKAMAEKNNDPAVRPNQELIALGAGKLVGAFFQSFPSTGSFSRSAINNDAGARTPFASLFAALVVILVLLFLTPYFYYLPNATLAAIIMVSVFGLIDFRKAGMLWKNDRLDFYTLMTTFLITIFLGIQEGVIAGVILSVLLVLYRHARPTVAVLGQLPDMPIFRNIDRFNQAKASEEVLVVRFDAPLYFGNATYFKDRLKELIDGKGDPLKVFILDGSSINDIDSSGMAALGAVLDYLEERQVVMYLVNFIGPVRDALYRFGFVHRLGEGRLFFSVLDAMGHYYGHFHYNPHPDPGAAYQTNEKGESK